MHRQEKASLPSIEGLEGCERAKQAWIISGSVHLNNDIAPKFRMSAGTRPFPNILDKLTLMRYVIRSYEKKMVASLLRAVHIMGVKKGAFQQFSVPHVFALKDHMIGSTGMRDFCVRTVEQHQFVKDVLFLWPSFQGLPNLGKVIDGWIKEMEQHVDEDSGDEGDEGDKEFYDFETSFASSHSDSPSAQLDQEAGGRI